MKICDETLKKSTQCSRSCACLNEMDKGPNCKVIDCINHKVHFVECKNDTSCSCLMPFGNSFICNCPVRKELYNKYGI